MGNLFRGTTIAVLVSLAAACGGTEEANANATASDALTKSFEPVAAFTQVEQAAAPYASGLVAVSLQAQRVAKGTGAVPELPAFKWVWTAMGTNGIFVDVQVSASGATVLAHGRRMLYAGEGTFDPSKVLVNGEDVLALANLLGLDEPNTLTLGSTLATETTGPRWTVISTNGTLTIDAVTGKTCGK